MPEALKLKEMTVLKLKISDNNLDQLVNYLIQERQFDYEKHTDDLSILISDNHRLLDSTSHLNIVIMKKEASFIYIDVISGGGEDGLFDFSGSVDKGYARLTAKVIYEYAELYELQVEAV
jgi:hypothetical protein